MTNVTNCDETALVPHEIASNVLLKIRLQTIKLYFNEYMLCTDEIFKDLFSKFSKVFALKHEDEFSKHFFLKPEEKARNLSESLKNSVKCLKSLSERLKSVATCLCYNTACSAQVSHGKEEYIIVHFLKELSVIKILHATIFYTCPRFLKWSLK